MPGFVLEEPFPLARFHNTVGEGDGKHFVVGLNSLESTLNNNSSERLDDADLVAITVQGEGFKIYNVIMTLTLDCDCKLMLAYRLRIKSAPNPVPHHQASLLLDLQLTLMAAEIPMLLITPTLL